MITAKYKCDKADLIYYYKAEMYGNWQRNYPTELQLPPLQGPLLLTWDNFNSSMDK